MKVGIGTGTGRTLDWFVTRLVPVSPRGLNDYGRTASRLFNSQLHGLYYTDTELLVGATIEAYWLLRREARVDDAVHTMGARVDAAYGPWSIDGEVATQRDTYGGQDHQAGMLHVGGSLGTTLPGRLRLGAALNLGQGDDDPNDGMHRTFDNLYPLNHAFYGSMDLFALQNLRNVELSVDAALPGRVSVRTAYQHFALLEPATDAWYNAGAGVIQMPDGPVTSSYVGSEVDVTVKLPLWEVGLEAGYGHFFGGRYLTESRLAWRSADFFYLQTIVGF